MTVKLPSADDFERPTPNVTRHVSSYELQPHGMPMAKAMSDIGKMIIVEQEKLDDIKAEDAVNKAKLRALELASGDDGYSSKVGEDVVNQTVHKNYTDRYKSAIADVESSLGNPNQINKFRRRVAPLGINYQKALLGHIAQETDNYADLTDASSLEIERSSAAANFMNPGAVADARGRSLYTINSTLDRKKIKGKVNRDAFKLKELTKFHIGVINAMLVNHPGMAKEYFAKYGTKDKKTNEIDGGKHDEIRALLNKGAVLGKAQTLTDEIMLEKLSRSKSLDLVRKNKKLTPEERKATEYEVNSRFDEHKLIKSDYIQDAEEHLINNDDLSAFPQEKKEIIGQANINVLERVARAKRDGIEPITNDKDFYAFQTKLRKASEGDKAAISFIRHVDMYDMYREVLNDADFRAASSAQQAWLVGDAKAKAASAKSNKEFLNNRAAADYYIEKLVDKKRKKFTLDDEEFANWFYRNAQKNSDIWHAENPGVTMPATVRDELLHDFSTTADVKDAAYGWWNDYEDMDIEDIKMEHLKEITASLREERKAVTASNILKEFAERIRIGKYDY